MQLAVSDLPRSVDFYERVLGLPLIADEEHGARLGSDPEQPALVLTDIEQPTRLAPRSTGLYHVAWLHPSRAALAASVRRVVGERWRFEGAADHGVSEALYLSDPDGLGIELYVDRPRERWERPPDGRGVNMYTLPLDVEDLLAQAPGTPDPAIAAGTNLGHVHLKVSDVPRAAAFYGEVLGFEHRPSCPRRRSSLPAATTTTSGLNSWQSAGAGAGPRKRAGPAIGRVRRPIRPRSRRSSTRSPRLPPSRPASVRRTAVSRCAIPTVSCWRSRCR